MFAPLLSEADPKESQEGTIDPLGTYPIADALGVRLAPGVRERQSRPRFLTAMAVSFAVCNEFDEGRVAADEVSEPWQVFEWYVVEGLVRILGPTGRLSRVPGTDKATAAIRDGLPLSASRYLKTPRIFGFHGVYRTLARELGVETLDHLGETGYELVSVWSREQGLEGFYDSSKGPGSTFRALLADAVAEGLAKGHTSRGNGWQGWNFIAEHLAPDDMGRKEGKVLIRALAQEDGGFRRPILECISKPEVQEILSERLSNNALREKAFHAKVRVNADAALRNLLDTIRLYERFARHLQDAFEDCLYEMSQSKHRLSPRDLKNCTSVEPAAKAVPDLYEQLLEELVPYGEAFRFQETFAGVAERQPPEAWVESLLEHHRRVQRGKPPNGKASWFERFDDGTYLVRPAYLREKPGLHQDEYVHFYRTGPMLSFARDLGMVD